MTLTDEVRGLLARLQDRLDPHIDARDWGMLCDLLAAQPEPQGVELEVVAWRIEHPTKQWKVYEQRQEWAYHEYGGIKYTVQELMTVAQHQHLLSTERAEAERKMAEKHAEIARLRQDLRNAFNDDLKMATMRNQELEIKQLRARFNQLEDRYQREVYGLNNEGDPIGGEPAGGYVNDLARLRARVAKLEARQVVMPAQCVDRAMPNQYRCGWNSCLAAVARLNAKPAGEVES